MFPGRALSSHRGINKVGQAVFSSMQGKQQAPPDGGEVRCASATGGEEITDGYTLACGEGCKGCEDILPGSPPAP